MRYIPLIIPIILFLFLAKPLIVFSTAPEPANKPVNDSMLIRQAEGLIRQAEKQEVTSPRKALVSAQKAAELLAGSDNTDHLLSQAFIQTANAYLMLGIIDSSVIWFNKVLSLPDVDATAKGKALGLLAIDYKKLGNYDKAHQYANEGLKVYRAINDSAGIIKTLINDARVYNSTGNHKKAMQLYFEALKFTEKAKDTLKTGQLYGWIANVYMDIDQDKKGKIYYRKAIQQLKNYKSTSYYGDLLNNYGIVFYDDQAYDSALYYFNKALEVYKNIGQTDAIAASYQNIGITYVFMDNETKGLKYLHLAMDMFKASDLQQDMASVLVDMGRACIETNRFDSAGYYLNKALDISSAINHAFYKKEALLLLYKMNEKAGNYKRALTIYKNYVVFKDSLDSQEMKENFQELEIKYKTAKREKEILRLKDQELLDRADKRLLSLGIVGLVLFFILTMTLILMKRKKDLQIHRQKALVHQKEKALSRAELARREAHEKRLENELEFKTKQLATHALNMMQKNKLLQDMTEHISNGMKHIEGKGKDELKRFKHELQQGLNVDSDWDLFKLYFEQINESFFDELKKINPALTGNDYKLCALIKLNMSVKEMASVLNISADSLKNGRYRLKKKLKLGRDEDMNSMIRNI